MQNMLTPHVRAIGRPAGPAQDDAVDAGLVEGTAAALKNDLIGLIGKEQVLHRISDLPASETVGRHQACCSKPGSTHTGRARSAGPRMASCAGAGISRYRYMNRTQ
jgi:hypothetical protein